MSGQTSLQSGSICVNQSSFHSVNAQILSQGGGGRKTCKDTEMGTEAGEEVGTSQSHSRHKKGHITNIYLMDSDEEAIVDFVKYLKELYDKSQV